MRLKQWAYAATILAGTHMAQSVLPAFPDEQPPPAIPIQWYGPGYGGPPPYMEGPPPWEQGGPGWYGRRGYGGPWWGRDMNPDDMDRMQRYRFQYRYSGPRPPWAGRPW